jgi:hypothetical protein
LRLIAKVFLLLSLSIRVLAIPLYKAFKAATLVYKGLRFVAVQNRVWE